MRNPISSAPRYAEFSGFDDIAKRLTETYKDTFDGIKPRSLSIYIGELDRGKVTWWIKRPDQTQCLAEFLGIDQDELNIQQNSGRHVFSFPGFKDCPPLDLMREDTWQIAEPRLVSDIQGVLNSRFYVKPTLDVWKYAEAAVWRSSDIEWLQIPDDVEYQLLTRKLAALRPHGISERRSLQDVLQRDFVQVRHQQALIILVENGAQRKDLFELAYLRHSAPSLIISPCPLPELTSERSADLSAASEMEAKSDSLKPAGSQQQPKINQWIWTLLPDWDELLLKWVGERNNRLKFNNTLYDSERALALLNRLDPGRRWFLSVGDLLILCQAASESGKTNLENQAGSAGNVEKLLRQLFGREDSALDWVQPVVKARWERWDLPWAGELSQDAWIDLSKNLCQWETLLSRNVITRGKEGYNFQRPVLARLLLRDDLMKRLLNSEPASWVSACFDSERRPLLDAALDALDIKEFRTVGTKLMQAPESTGIIGGVEAVFAAIGRRLARGKETFPEEVRGDLTRIAALAIKAMRWQNGLLYPWSRPISTPDEQLEWLTACWAWSLLPPPDIDILPGNWMFPGWATTKLANVPNWLEPLSGQAWERYPVQMDAFLRVVMQVLEGQDNPVAFGNQSVVSNIALLASASPDKQPASQYWWAGVLGTSPTEQALLRLVESCDAPTKRAKALAWWPSLVKAKREEGRFSRGWGGFGQLSARLTPPRASFVIDWVLTHAANNPARAIKALDDEDVVFLTMNPESLPVQLRKELLRGLRQRNLLGRLQSWEEPGFLSKFGPEPKLADELEAYLDVSSALGLNAAQCLWNWDPCSAERLLAQMPPLERTALRHLILCSPDSAIPKVIDFLRKDRELLQDDERLGWVYSRLSNARQYAQDLMQLVSQS